jgi:hypothetical protein
MSYPDDSSLPEVTDDMLQGALQSVRPYTIVILKPGPNFSAPGPDRDAGVARTIWEHGKRNLALRMAGVMPIVCPVRDGSDVTGVSIFDATPEEVHRLMSEDPAVRAGVLAYEVHPTHSFPGSTLGSQEADVDWSPEPAANGPAG